MQDRYVGDIGDYVKFAILRAIMPNHRLGVAWWLYPDEGHNKNGRHITYLNDPARWRQFDPDLFDHLDQIAKAANRNVKALETASLFPGATFFDEPVQIDGTPAERRKHRLDWFARLNTALADRDIIFVDPDNGLEPAGFSTGAKIAGKSVSLDELKQLAAHGRSLVVYHHQTRRKGGHFEELKFWAAKLTEQGFHTVDCIRSHHFSPRAFFLLNAPPEIRSRAEYLVRTWNKALTWHPAVHQPNAAAIQ